MKVLSSLVIIAAAIVIAALLALNVTNYVYYVDSVPAIAYHFGVPAAMAVGLLAALRLSREWRLVLALCLLAVLPALYGAELYLGMRVQKPKAGVAAEFDHRGKLQVILDLRRQGIDAYPVMRAKSMLVDGPHGGLVPALGGDGPLPLASLANKRVVSCNETGRWLIYDSDKYGFHNPPDAWTTQPLRVALVGDSFAHGSCVASDENIAADLRRRYGSALSLGVSGFGPLAELASIKEYLTAVKPKVVAWLYFEGNDLFEDLPFERRSKILMSYLKDGYSQHLMARVAGTDKRFKTYLDARMLEAMARVDDPHQELTDFLELYHLRESLGIDPVGLGVIEAVTPGEYRLFRDVLVEARRTVESWGGRMLFVFLPDSPRYFAAARDSRIRDRVRERVLDIVAGLKLPMVDVHTVFAAQPDPRALFVFPGSHYNAAGYRVTADAIAHAIDGPAAERPLMATGGRKR